MKVHTDSKQRKKRRSNFSDQISADCNDRSDSTPLRNKDQIKKITSSHTEDLLNELDTRRKSRLFSPEIITVDAAMKSAQRNTERKQTNQRNCLRFFQNMTGPEIGISIKKPGKYQGKRNRKHSSRQKIVPCAPGMPESDLGGCEPGNGSLDTGSAHRQDQKLQRKDELENSQPVSTNCMRKEYSVKETDQTAEQTCESKQQSSPDEELF